MHTAPSTTDAIHEPTARIHRRANHVLAAAAIILATTLGLLATWRPTRHLSTLTLDWPSWPELATATAITTGVCLAIVATNRPCHRARRWIRWTGRAAGLLTALAALGCVIGASGGPGQTITLPAAPVPPRASIDLHAADLTALHGLMRDYQWTGPSAGRWTSSWWTTALEVDAVARAEMTTRDRSAVPALEHTYATNRRFAGGERDDGSRPDWANHYADDTAWWGVALLDESRLTGEVKFSEAAEVLDNYLAGFWTSTCGGGLRWAVPLLHGGQQKNTITNSVYLELSAGLYAATHQPVYLQRALAEWQWLSRSGLIGRDGLLVDHLTDNCSPAGVAWTYNQGPVLDALTALAATTGQPAYLTEARRLATASTTSARLNPHGILTDPCVGCGGDVEAFKGPMVAGVASINAALPGHPYTAWLTRQATTAYRHDRMVGDLYGTAWAGPPDTTSPTRQTSALSLITATLEH
jgi:predicted alpha-1,6-mannanase (GH76 family)